MFYGQSGTAKSENLLQIIRLVAKATGKRARIYVGDGSAATYIDSGLVGAGLVEVFSWEGRDWPISTLDQFAEGYRPADKDDPTSPLVAPTAAELKEIGVWGFEGLSVAGNYIMGDQKGGLAYRAARGEKLGQDTPFAIVEGVLGPGGKLIAGSGPGRTYGGNPLAHYGVAQKRLLGILERSKSLPGEFVVWTAHERSAEDKVTKETVIGPEAAGGAMTATIQRYFGNTLHHVTAEKRAMVKDDHTGRQVDDLDVEFRIYTRDHISPTTKAKYKAVTRGGLSEAEMPLYLTSPVPGAAIEEFYTRLRTVRISREADVQQWKKPAEAPAA
jgi:hypothetical protein